MASRKRTPPTFTAKMMALAVRLDQLIKTGQVNDQAELARIVQVAGGCQNPDLGDWCVTQPYCGTVFGSVRAR